VNDYICKSCGYEFKTTAPPATCPRCGMNQLSEINMLQQVQGSGCANCAALEAGLAENKELIQGIYKIVSECFRMDALEISELRKKIEAAQAENKELKQRLAEYEDDPGEVLPLIGRPRQ